MKVPILGVKPWVAWDREKNAAGETLGTAYTVLRIKRSGPVLVKVKVPGEAVISSEDITKSFQVEVVIWGNFTDYEEDIYTIKGVTYHVATAAAAEIVMEEVV